MKVWELEEGKEYQTNLNTSKYRIDNGKLRVYDGLLLTWKMSDMSYNTVLDMDFTLYTPPTDWSKVEADTKVLVRDFDNNIWSKRYFAEYKDDEYYAYADGKTSWSSDGDETQWNQMKLYKEE